MEATARGTILRIELWHGILVAILLAGLVPSGLIDAKGLVFGGVFMGVNFLLLSLGVAWMLTPLAGAGRVKAGIALLVTKILLFLGLLTMLFYRMDLDALSFTLGFSSLLVAIFIEVVRKASQLET
jgi:hypothetical protein